jgi:hypothetical protein
MSSKRNIMRFGHNTLASFSNSVSNANRVKLAALRLSRPLGICVSVHVLMFGVEGR